MLVNLDLRAAVESVSTVVLDLTVMLILYEPQMDLVEETTPPHHHL